MSFLWCESCPLAVKAAPSDGNDQNFFRNMKNENERNIRHSRISDNWCMRMRAIESTETTRRGGKQTILISVTLDVQTFASRKFRECQNSRNFWHKLSRMRHKNLFCEHKLSRIDAFILYFLEKIKQKRGKNENNRNFYISRA